MKQLVEDYQKQGPVDTNHRHHHHDVDATAYIEALEKAPHNEEFSHCNSKPSAALPNSTGLPLPGGGAHVAASLKIPPPPQVGRRATPIATNSLLTSTSTQRMPSSTSKGSHVAAAIPNLASFAKSAADDKSDQDVMSPNTEGKVPLKGIKLPYCGIPVVDEYNGLFSEGTVNSLEQALKTKPGECFDKGTNEEEQAAFIRNRNAIYSKRKYYKKKLKIESLQVSKNKLLKENEELREEGKRLELLLFKARRHVALLPQRHNLSSGMSSLPLASSIQDPFASSLASGSDLSQESLALSLLCGNSVAQGRHSALAGLLSSLPAAPMDPHLRLLLLQESSAASEAAAAQPFLPTTGVGGGGTINLPSFLPDVSQRSSLSSTSNSQQQQQQYNLRRLLHERMLLDERILLEQVRVAQENELIAALTGTAATISAARARSSGDAISNDRLWQQLLGDTRISSQEQELLSRLLLSGEQQRGGGVDGGMRDCDPHPSLHSPP